MSYKLLPQEEAFIKKLAEFLPSRRPGRRGPKPVDKITILRQLFIKFKYGLPWRRLEHATVCYNYFQEMQRRGHFKKFFNSITEFLKEKRLKKNDCR